MEKSPYELPNLDNGNGPEPSPGYPGGAPKPRHDDGSIAIWVVVAFVVLGLAIFLFSL